LKDEGKKLFTEVFAFDNVYIAHATQSKIGGLGTGMNLLSELHSFSNVSLECLLNITLCFYYVSVYVLAYVYCVYFMWKKSPCGH